MLTHRLFGGGSSSPSISRPSLGPALIAVARARLWSLFRRRSESPLLARRETKRQEKVSCLFGSCILFPGLPTRQLWCTNPFRLCSRRQPQSSPCDPTEALASVPSPARPGRGADKALRLVSAARCRASVQESLRFALRTPVAALSSMALKLPPSATRSLCPRRGFLVHGNLSSFTAPSHWCRCRPYSFVCYFFFLLPYPSTGGVSCLFGGRTFSVSVQWVFCRSSSTCRCISTVSVGRKVISVSYSSAIFSPPPQAVSYWEYCDEQDRQGPYHPDGETEK